MTTGLKLSLFVFTLLGITIIPSCKGKSDDQRPNVLIISIDDLNNWIEPMGGHPQAKTPYLLSFSEEAVTFSNAYCASPACNPSRTALFTGKHPYVTGLYNNPQLWRDVIGDEPTLPEWFMQQGYYVAGAGKIYHGNMPDPRSWHEYFPDKIKHMPDYWLPSIDMEHGDTIFTLQDNEIREDDPDRVTFNMPWFEGMYIAFDWAPLPVTTEQTGDYSTVKWVIDQLEKEHDKPFFIACGLYRPHLPWYVPMEFYENFPIDSIELPLVYNDDWSDLPESAKRTAAGRYHQKVSEAGQWENAVQGYLASINYADYLTGQLLNALKKSDYYENTIVVVFSDHGWQLGEKNHWRKFALWENVINSVLMMRVPEGVKMGSASALNGLESRENVSLVDIFPTLTEICGLPSKPGVTGSSLVPELTGVNPKEARAIITTLGDRHFSVIEDNWHYILYNECEQELYNLDTDPEEWHNLAVSEGYEDKIAEMKQFIPTQRHPLVQTRLVRWEDVLTGKIDLR